MGPPLGPGGEDITWPDQVAPRGRKASSTRKHKPQTSNQEDHLILLGEFFAVCQENHTRLKLTKCEFMQETMQYLGFDAGYGWWTPAASRAKCLMDAKV